MWSPSNPPRGVRQRENGRWIVERVVNGKRKPKTVEAFEEAMQLWHADRAGVVLPEPPKVAPKGDAWGLQKAFDLAMETVAREGGFQGNRSTPEYHWRPIVRYFGEDFPIDQMRRDTDDERALRKKGHDDLLARTLDGFVRAQRLGRVAAKTMRRQIVCKDTTIDKQLNVLRTVLTLAVKKGHLGKLPEFPARLADVKYKIRFFTEEEEAGLLASPERRFVEFMTVAIDTGLRVSELQALDRPDVDFKVGILLVHGRDARGTKNGEFRSVPMTARVRAIMERRALAGWDSFDYDYMVLWRHFKGMKARLGLADDPLFTIHTARHTCASRLVQRGVRIEVVKEWLGHKDIESTMRYAHLKPQNLLDAVHVLEPQQAAPPPPRPKLRLA
jgi:integrase